MTRDTGPAHIARAVLEAVCYQSYELLEAMADDVGEDIEMLRIDGGMANNDWLAQYLADICVVVDVQRRRTKVDGAIRESIVGHVEGTRRGLLQHGGFSPRQKVEEALLVRVN